MTMMSLFVRTYFPQWYKVYLVRIFFAANIAVHSKKTVRQHATIQERSQFTLDETRNRSTPLMLPVQQGTEVL